jgi:FKBP-type peptidyl-prolyl cis-trans isomerase FkpA
MKKIALVITIALFAVTACKKSGESGYDKTPGGLLYNKIHITNSPKAKVGDVLMLNFTERTESDSVVQSSRASGRPATIMVREPKSKGGLEEGLVMIGIGDSISFLVPVDSFIHVANPTPQVQKQIDAIKAPFKKHGNYVKIDLMVTGLKSQADVMKEQAAAAEQAAAQEKTAIPDYLAANKIKAQQTASGLYYAIDKKGKGPLPKPGQSVTVNYTGTLLDGTVFDSSLKPGRQPFTFTLGQGQVIKGWDEGIALLPVGSKGHLIVPTELAYGANGRPGIPPNSPLVFDIEVISVK